MALTESPQTGIISAAGTATLQFRPPRGGAEVQQVGIKAPNVGGGAVGNITKNKRIITPFVATGDAPSGAPYVRLQAGDVLAAEWTSGTPGAAVEANFIYDDYS